MITYIFINQFSKLFFRINNIIRHYAIFENLYGTTPIKVEQINIYFDKYNPQGGVPTFVFGCKYIRVGNGYESTQDLEAEKKEFVSLIEELAP